MPKPLMGVPRISGMELSLRELQQHQEKRHGWRATSILCREDCIFFTLDFVTNLLMMISEELLVTYNHKESWLTYNHKES